MALEENATFLGFDWSTQKLKAGIVNKKLQIIHEAEVDYDADLPEFKTNGGVWRNYDNSLEVKSPPLMWVKALDLVLERLLQQKADLKNVVAISGAAQQHGAVWWSAGAEERLSALDPKYSLHEQLEGAFAGPSPVWQDSSTSTECLIFERTAGGPEALARATGSRAYERFTGPQILKAKNLNTKEWRESTRISLVSSATASLLLGKIVPIDYSDGSGMNLLDITTKTWFEPIVELCGRKELKEKIIDAVPSNTVLGNISRYYVEKYGFDTKCKIVAFTGDNPASLAGLQLSQNTAGISLGTSDTLLLGLDAPVAPLVGHILIGPLPDTPYMALLCFTNGSLTRQNVIKRAIGTDAMDWSTLETILKSTPLGNNGNIGIYYETAETVPRVGKGSWRWDSEDQKVVSFPPNTEIRALLEGQAIARRAHAEDMGFKIESGMKLLATGGAAVSKSILQILSDVFNAPVYIQEYTNSTVLGSAIRAAEAIGSDIRNNSVGKIAATPQSPANLIYEPMIERYRRLVATLPTLCEHILSSLPT